MKQTIRKNTFETNSSSMHCLTVEKHYTLQPEDEEIFLKHYEIYPYSESDGISDDPMQFKTIEQKLRYLWTLRCKSQEWNYCNADDEQIDEFTSMLRAIFPNTNFYDIDKVLYMEDFDYWQDDLLMFNEDFIKRVFVYGEIWFTSRDYTENDWKTETIINDLRRYDHNDHRDTAKWEG